MAKEPEFKHFSGKVVEDKSEGAHFVKGRVLVEKDGEHVAVVVPFNEPSPEVGETIKVAYIEKPVAGGMAIEHAKLVKAKPDPAKK